MKHDQRPREKKNLSLNCIHIIEKGRCDDKKDKSWKTYKMMT